MKKVLSTFIFICALTVFGEAQSVHFTQFTANPILFNPANTGYTNSCLRIGTNTRQQWLTFRNYYKTYTAFADVKLPPNQKKPKWPKNQDWFGTGISAYTDEAGDGLLSTTNAKLSFAFHTPIQVVDLSIGFGAGFYNKSVNYDKLYFNNQWNGYFFDSGLPNSETHQGVMRSEVLPDLSGGAAIHFPSNKKESPFSISCGFSYSQIAASKETFYNFNNVLSPKTTYHASYCGPIVPGYLTVEADFMQANQGNSSEMLYGLNLFSDAFPKLLLGTWLRHGQEYAINVGYQQPHSKAQNYGNQILLDRLWLTYEYNEHLNNRSIEISLRLIRNYKNCKCDFGPSWSVKSGRGYEKRIKQKFKGTKKGECHDWTGNNRRGVPLIYWDTKYLSFMGDFNSKKNNGAYLNETPPMGTSVTLGTNIDYFFLGAGIGYEKWGEFYFIPVFVNLKYYVPGFGEHINMWPNMFLFADMGYSLRSAAKEDNVQNKGGTLMNLGFGFDKTLRKLNKRGLLIQFGYRIQHFTTTRLDQPINGVSVSKPHFIEIKIGMRI